MTVNWFCVCVFILVLCVISIAFVTALKTESFLSWCCGVIGSIDVVVIIIGLMIIWCCSVEPVREFGAITEYSYITDFAEIEYDGISVRAFRDLNTDEYLYVPASKSIVMNENPVILAKYEVIEYLGVKGFYWQKRVSEEQFVFE